MQFPRTKIVATIGPATHTPGMIGALLDAGVSVFRLNFSHGTHQEHSASATMIRDLARQRQRTVGILQDLQGPKLRVGDVADEPVQLQAGATFRICTQPVPGTSEMVSTSYDRLASDVSPGDAVLINDGRIRLEVTALTYDTGHGDVVTLKVLQGGLLSSHKGINLPGTPITAPALSSKDRRDLDFGVRLGVDLIALSFVREPGDVYQARELIRSAGGTQPLIAKIEKPQAIDVLPPIIDAADGVMVARGDLGVELGAEAVPLIQKHIIRLANARGKPVITATQMLESMISAPHPTRAEASDVANAILDGSDAVMLSGETAIGDWPVQTVQTMRDIALTIERERIGTPWQLSHEAQHNGDRPDETRAIAHAARALADDLGARAIVVLTDTGGTAQCVSQERPVASIVALTGDAGIGRRLALWRGVVPVVTPLEATVDDLVAQCEREMLARSLAAPGDRLVIVGINPKPDDRNATFLEIHTLATP